MSMQNNIPNYADLFGNIDFKEGDDARSVYSPAAYLTDLLQMLDDEFVTSEDNFDLDDRRSDIKDIDLDAENTNTLIPYLDIVNEVLEGRVSDTSDETYATLESAAYPFNMPFSLDNEKIKNHLHHLGISAHELRRLFATDTDYYTVAREHLGLSSVELETLLEPEAVTEDAVKNAYGYTGDSFISDMSTVGTFMETTDLQAQEMRELLYQKLYIDPADHSTVEEGRENFYINTGISEDPGYVTLSTDESTFEWTGSSTSIPLAWFDRTSRFVRLAQKTGLSFTDLDHILRHCCKVDGTPTLNEDTLLYIAQVVYLHKTLEQPIDKVVAVLSEIDFTGRTNEDLPQDQFNRIFNLPCVSVNEKYLHVTEVTGEVPEQYDDTTYNTYTPIVYYPDLFSDENDDYRKRLRHSLGFTDTDLTNITNRLEFEEVADSSLWENTENEWQLLNVLYRIRSLCDALDVHFLELFTLFDLLEQDPFISRFDPHTYFVYNAPTTHKCFEIFMAGANGYYSSAAYNPTSSAIVYFDSEYEGASQKLVHGQYDSSDLSTVGNNTISSLKVPNGWTVTLYDEESFQDTSQEFTTDTSWVGSEINDRTSYIVVTGLTSNTSDQLWLFESLVALTKWMKEFGYSAEMLWKIVNGAPMTDKEEAQQKEQELALYNNLLQSFKAGEIRPDTLKDALGDERASHFAFSLIKGHCGDKHEYKPLRRRKPSRFRKHIEYKEHKHLLLAYKPREIHELAEDFIQQLATISDYEFIGLQLENKLIEKIFNNLVNHKVIDGSGKILTENLIDQHLPPIAEFEIEYDFSDIEQKVFELFHRIYQEADAAKLEESDTIEVQVFKSDLKELGLTETEARELYDNLIYNGYIDSEGYAQDVSMFSDASGAGSFALTTGLGQLARPVYHLLKRQFDKFKASKVKISEQMFTELDLKPVALQDLIENLKMNRYIDEHMFVKDKMRIVNESPKTMALALQFYPHRKEIFKALKDAIAADQNTWLKIDQVELGKIAATAVSRWVYEDLQGSYLDGKLLQPGAGAFFKEEKNRDSFSLRPYFDANKATIIFDHIAGIINYADNYRLKDEKLAALDFNADEIRGLKQLLEEIDVIDGNSILLSDRLPFFLIPENAATFSVPGFEDYDTEIFFELYDIAKAIDGTVKAVDKAMKEHSDTQQSAILEQLQSVLGMEMEAVKAVSKAVFKTDNNLHFPWLQPLLEEANALGRLDEIPDDMHYTQAVKRIRQLALLINKEQLDINEISLLLEDQDLVAKFPEDMILPDDITSVDAILESEEFIYLFKDDYYWIYLTQDYTLIDKKEVVAGIDDDDDLIDLQKEDEELQKRLKEDPIRQLFDKLEGQGEELSQINAAFIDRYGTWVVVSGDSHYVKYANTDVWDKRSNQFGQVDNDFDNLEMIDAAYVDSEGRLFLFANDKYVRYSDVTFTLDSSLQGNAEQPTVDWGYPKSIAEDWNDENLPIQLPPAFSRDLGPMFDGLDDNSYAFLGEHYISSEDGSVRRVAEKWGHREYNFGQTDHIDAAMAHEGNYLFFLDDKVAKYAGSIELANLQPEEGYPKPLHEEFTSLPDQFVLGIDAALYGEDEQIYLFRDDEFVSIDPGNTTSEPQETRSKWGIVTNNIAIEGQVDAAFVGLDGYTYMFSGEQYVRYSGSNYSQVDDGFPRNISEDWEGLTNVTGAFVLSNKTYLFGSSGDNTNLYVRYSTLRKDEDDYLEVDEEDPNARVIETVLANRPDVDEIEVFPATVNEEFWSLPESITGGASDFQIDAVMNGPEDKVYLFYDNYYVEHDHANRWWSEPKILSEQWDRTVTGLDEGDRIVAAFTGKDGKTYLFYNSKYLRFSDPELRRLDNGYPRPTKKFWGKVRNNIDKTGKVDAALVVESRWEEQNNNGQLVDMTAMHTYLFSGDQMFRYEGSDYSAVEPGYPRSIKRLHEEPRFRGLQIGFPYEDREYSNGRQRHQHTSHRYRKLPFKGLHTSFPEGIDAAFADQRQVYLFKGNSFHVVIGDEDNYKQYDDSSFADIQAVTQEKGISYVLSSSNSSTWQKLNHLEANILNPTSAMPRTAEKADGKLTDNNGNEIAINAILHGTDGKSYVFAGEQYYDVDLERSFAISNVWGRSRNPIYDQETIDAAFVGRDGVTYVFSGEWFVQYDSATYVGETVTYPPRRIRDKWRDLDNVALAYVWKEETYLFERPKPDGTFHYLRYSKDSYERPDPGYPRQGDYSLWNIPEEHQREGFDTIDAIFVQDDNLIFISDQKFISFNLNTEIWSYPQPLELIYSGIPFNKTDFQDLKSGFVGADGTAYFFNEQCYVSYNSTDGWEGVAYIKDDWGLQSNILSNGVSAAWVSGDGVTYLFAGNSYVRYSGADYRYVDEGYPKEIATYLRSEPAFKFMTKEFQQHLDALEEEYSTGSTSDFFNGLLDNGRCLYFFTSNTLFTGSPNRYVAYEIDGIGHIENNFTLGGYVDAAFVNIDKEETYLFSGEQYIRYTGDRYRYIDEDYPKIIAESLADDLGIDSLGEDYRNGIDAAFYLSSLGLVLFNDQNYLNVTANGQNSSSTAGDVNEVWGLLENAFSSSDSTINGAYIDEHGALYVFKEQQFVRYSDTAELFALNRYDEPRYVDQEYPRYINEIWPQLDSTILTDAGVSTVFKFEDQIYFHTKDNFVTYELDLSDQYEQNPVQVLAYRWGEWSDYLLSDVHTISRFKDLGQRFMGGELTLTELVSGAKGEVKEPYMHFAAIFGFEKEEVRWVKQRNAFLAGQVNAAEEYFDLELVLRLYDILATTQRLRVDVSSLYNDVWLNLYGTTLDYSAAATGAYDVLVAVDCDNNYATLVKQITNELNTIKRNALVPYVIANDSDITTTRQLYQKLLIDIQMDSCAETSRIKEATAAVQLFIHRYFMNLENLDLDASDQQVMKAVLKDRWQWLQNYRVWEANRKVFLYPENYIRPELRDTDTKSRGFKALEDSLSQGQLTEESIEEAYFKYLDAFTEVSELTIAGGYSYDETDSEDKKLVVFGHTRTDPMRYFYRFGTFVDGKSNSAIWDPWKELDISIEATRVEPVYAFNRVFVFWTTIEETSENPASAEVTTTDSGSNTQTVSSEGNSTYEVKIFYSFYNLNKQWTQPQALQTEFDGSSQLKSSYNFSDIELFVENSTKLKTSEEDYENIYISVRSYAYTIANIPIYAYAAYNLTPELYSQEGDIQTVQNRGQELFTELFPAEGGIEKDNVVMLNYSANSVDGPWFAYNHKGSGFLVKPDPESMSTSEMELKDIDTTNTQLLWRDETDSGITINAAVQVVDDGDIIYFLDNNQYVIGSVSGEGIVTFSEPADINTRWGIEDTSVMQSSGVVDSAFMINSEVYLTLNDSIYLYDFNGNEYDTGLTSPSRLVKKYYDNLSSATFPDWAGIGAGFTASDGKTYLFEKDGTRVFIVGDTGTKTLEDLFGYYIGTNGNKTKSNIGNSSTGIDAAFIGTDSVGVSGALYLFLGNEYYRFSFNNGAYSDTADDGYPLAIDQNNEDFPLWDSIDAAFTYNGVSYFFYNDTANSNANPVYYSTASRSTESTIGVWGALSVTELQINQVVDAAYSTGTEGYLYLIAGNEYYRYYIESDGSIKDYVDDHFPKTLPNTVVNKWTAIETALGEFTTTFDNINNQKEAISAAIAAANTTESSPINLDAAFVFNNYFYFFSGSEYYRLDVSDSDSDPGNLTTSSTIKGSWGNLPSEIRSSGLDAALNYVKNNSDGTTTKTLYLIKGNQYISYDLSTEALPYEINDVYYEVIRLTSSTAEQLNQILFAEGIDELLKLSTQEINESPTISFGDSTPTNISMSQNKFTTEPTNSHLDFQSANGIYYWEVFFHTPFLIAQTLNTDQQFEDAKEWYEYIFDPTEISDYWKFLPFLAVDPDALMASLSNDIDAFEALLIKEYDLSLLNSTDPIPSDGNNLVIVAKTENSYYHARIFNHNDIMVVDNEEVGFSDATFVGQLEEAFDSESIDNQTKTELIKTIIRSIDYSPLSSVRNALLALMNKLAPYQEVFLGITNITLTEDSFSDGDKLANIATWSTFETLETEISNLDTDAVSETNNKALLVTWQSEMQEVMAILEKLNYRINLMGNYSAQLTEYLEDPFDPHAIAVLRPLAYRKAIVMRYIDNLLDWGDMLFRQYTRESINEARMLYILAYDLLGEKPKNMGRVVLEPTQSYNGFYTDNDVEPNEAYDFLIDLENTTTSGVVNYEQSLSFAATQFDTITNPYFYLKENELFTEYWTRVEDRLGKIRACLNIDGVAQPLPLFQPPIDPMALVNAAASGGGLAGAAGMIAGMATVPDYRFNTLLMKARDLAGKLKGLGDSLLSALEKKDAEELSLLQGQQEALLLDLTTVLKEEAILEAEQSLENLKETKQRAEDQEDHYDHLIADGYLPEELTQLSMMGIAATLHGVTALSKYASGMSYIVPQFTAGPFSFGVTTGGESIGDMMAQFGEAIQSGAEALSMGGEVAGVAAQFKRSAQDWKLQKMMATSEIEQLKYQIQAQKHQITIAKQEKLIHEKDIENHQAIADFMKSKFSNLQLYSWMSGKISGLFFQTFKLAHDYAKQAEQAFIFEKGLQAGKVNYINGMYWDSQRKGLLSGAELDLDLDHLEKAYKETDSRRLEITKNISLLELDPIALVNLKTKGVCNFRFSEELFDYDFPGHYNRQIKTISLAFDVGEGQHVNATLTQLSSKLVMDTDIKAVKHLINPSNEATTNVRANWRANQQVALSHVDQYTENNGMFELNFGDERYLPFEGTGAVSNWRLELNGMKGSYNPADLLDVTIKLRYTAKQGGSRFANEVKGVLKPYHATSFFDLAYNFADEWAALVNGDSDEVTITFTQAMFPNMSSSKMIGLLIHYEYATGNSGATFTINDDLQVPNNTYLQPNTLSVGQNGSEWKFTLKGDRSTLKNAEMVVVYKAKV